MARSLVTRKADIAYLSFFIMHIPIMFLVDLQPLFPAVVRNTIPTLGILRQHYETAYKDRFFTDAAPAWFGVFVWLEALYHVPVSVWAVGALIRDDPKIPLQLLVFALEAGLTTLPCIVEVMTWPELSSSERANLLAMYGSYLALAVFMGVDMYGRLDRILGRRPGKKSQ